MAYHILKVPNFINLVWNYPGTFVTSALKGHVCFIGIINCRKLIVKDSSGIMSVPDFIRVHPLAFRLYHVDRLADAVSCVC